MKMFRKKIGVGALLCALVIVGVAALNGCSSSSDSASTGSTFTLKSSNSVN